MARCRKTNKVMHRNRQAAEVAVSQMTAKNGDIPRAYKCTHCYKWHIGNNRATRSINMNRRIDAALARDRALREGSNGQATTRPDATGQEQALGPATRPVHDNRSWFRRMASAAMGALVLHRK